ncbi:protein fem-1 homolog B-like [Orbicella faveolata]|uniref:protein fem-1 homolog B-like n=1 Tax=Orbicella faveolata TaxID=48498 RepID=UPI0009E1AAAC|nr:protein fem-1 homolog B-like [Orbicella faveolata]
MNEKRSKSKYTNPVAILYEAARDGAVVVLSDVLQGMSISERSTALETKAKDGDQITTPLIIAARNGNLDSVKMLLRYKADIEARGTVKVADQVIEGCTALWAAAATGHLDVVKLLIEQNADVDGGTLTNSTPLRAAAYNDHLKVVTYLIERGANMDLQDKKGNTALHEALYNGHFAIAKELVVRGASQLPNIQRLTPLLLASNNCQIDMVEYFINRPECTKEQRIEGLELLGATVANSPDVHDIEKAFSYMKRGMEERFEEKSCPLLKKRIEPLEVYQNRKESQTLEELVLLEGDDHRVTALKRFLEDYNSVLEGRASLKRS